MQWAIVPCIQFGTEHARFKHETIVAMATAFCKTARRVAETCRPTAAALDSTLVIGEHERVADLTSHYRHYTEGSMDREHDHDLLTFPNLTEASGWIEARHGAYCNTSDACQRRPASTGEKEKHIGISAMLYDFEHYLNNEQREALTRFEICGWDIACVRRMGYTNSLVVITDASKSTCPAIKRNGSVTRGIDLV